MSAMYKLWAATSFPRDDGVVSTASASASASAAPPSRPYRHLSSSSSSSSSPSDAGGDGGPASDDGDGGAPSPARTRPRGPSSAAGSRSARALRSVLTRHTAADAAALHPTYLNVRGGGRYTYGDGDGPPPGVLELDSGMTPMEAARVLRDGGVLGAPVWDRREDRYLGFYDMRDVLVDMVSRGKAGGGAGGGDNGGGSPDGGDGGGGGRRGSPQRSSSHRARHRPPGGRRRLLKRLRPGGRRFHACTPQTRLADLGRTLSLLRCHRMPVVSGGRCVAIVSQGGLVKFLHSHLFGAEGGGIDDGGGDIGAERGGGEADADAAAISRSFESGDYTTAAAAASALDETLDDAGLHYRKDVISVPRTATAAETFRLLVDRHLSGVAIVDGGGGLVGGTSARDIKRAVIDDGRTSMDLDIVGYLESIRGGDDDASEDGGDGDGEDGAPPEGRPRDAAGASDGGGDGAGAGGARPDCAHVSEAGATVGEVVRLLARTGQHRVFVLGGDGDDRRPVGVVSVTDIIDFAVGGRAERGGDWDCGEG